MIYYVVNCTYMSWTRYGAPKRIEIIFHRTYLRLGNARKAFKKYKRRALGCDNIRLTLYKVDISETDEFGFYKHEWIAEA